MIASYSRAGQAPVVPRRVSVDTHFWLLLEKLHSRSYSCARLAAGRGSIGWALYRRWISEALFVLFRPRVRGKEGYCFLVRLEKHQPRICLVPLPLVSER